LPSVLQTNLKGSKASTEESWFDRIVKMSFPIKTCAGCGEEFELRPDKPGFANRCPECSAPEADPEQDKRHLSAEERKAEAEANAERRKAIRDLLYRKDR
jgi:hypothetical protein